LYILRRMPNPEDTYFASLRILTGPLTQFYTYYTYTLIYAGPTRRLNASSPPDGDFFCTYT
jgi:hypothetical protein